MTDTEADSSPLLRTKMGVGFWLAFGAVAITNLAAAFDATTLSVALPVMSQTLGGDSVQAFWAGTSYPLAQCAVMLVWVSLSQCFGRRPMLLISLLLFGIGAILAAVVQGWTLLLVGRVVQGIGGGGLVGLTTVIITDLVPLRERGHFYALISCVWALGSTAGPILGGALSLVGAWRWIFWINLPIVGVGFVGIAIFLKLQFRQRTIKEKLREIDYAGVLLFVSSVSAFLIPVSWGGTQFAWDSWHTLTPLCLGSAGLVCFAIWEVKTTGPTLIPMTIFLNYSASILYLGSLFHGLILYSMVYYMPEWFQAVKGYSPLISGVAALPQTATVVPCAVAVGIVVGKSGRYRWSIWSGWALTTFGMGLLSYLHVNTSVPAWIFLSIVSGIGIGLLFPSIALAIQASTPAEEQATTSTLVLWFRSFGQSLGVAIGGTIFQNRMKVEVIKSGVAATLPEIESVDVVTLIEYIKRLPSDRPEKLLLREAFTRSFRTIWIVMCALAGCIMVASFFIKEYSMDQEHKTEQGFRSEALAISRAEASVEGGSNELEMSRAEPSVEGGSNVPEMSRQVDTK